MGDLVRTGVSLERDLLTKFDVVIEEKGYQNRSEAIRDLIRRHLVAEDIDKNKVVVGTVIWGYGDVFFRWVSSFAGS